MCELKDGSCLEITPRFLTERLEAKEMSVVSFFPKLRRRKFEVIQDFMPLNKLEACQSSSTLKLTMFEGSFLFWTEMAESQRNYNQKRQAFIASVIAMVDSKAPVTCRVLVRN